MEIWEAPKSTGPGPRGREIPNCGDASERQVLLLIVLGWVRQERTNNDDWPSTMMHEQTQIKLIVL